jgi:hypothetical protein
VTEHDFRTVTQYESYAVLECRRCGHNTMAQYGPNLPEPPEFEDCDYMLVRRIMEA